MRIYARMSYIYIGFILLFNILVLLYTYCIIYRIIFICIVACIYTVQLVERSASRTVKSILSRDAIKSLLPSLARLLDFTPPAIPVP